MEKVNRAIAIGRPRWLILVLVTFVSGVASGFGGLALALLLRLVQHIAFGHGLYTIVGRVSFLQEVTAASDLRRFLAPCSCGAVAGIGWWLLYRFGTPLVSIRQAVLKGGRMPFWATLTEATRARAPRDWRLSVCCSPVFPILGLLAIPFPQLLGNGKGLAQAGFENEGGLAFAATLLMLKVVVLVASLRAGAEAGLLTPGQSLGALIGIILW